MGKNDTAWNYREANWSKVIVGVNPDPATKDLITKWARDYWEDLHPYSARGAYVNFMMEEGDERIRAAYRDNYERLVEIKNKYDPQNFFRVNQKIRPSAAYFISRGCFCLFHSVISELGYRAWAEKKYLGDPQVL